VRYVARAPLCLQLGGDWTDLDGFARAEAGACLTAAISPYTSGTIARPDNVGLLRRIRSDRSYVSYSSSVPRDASLGVATAEILVWLALVKTATANTADRREIAAVACDIAKFMGIVDGKQVAYASALGGIEFLTIDDRVDSEEIILPLQAQQTFRDRLVLAYCGSDRPSVRRDIEKRFADGDPSVLAGLKEIKRLTEGMRTALRDLDLAWFASLMTDHAAAQDRVSPTSPGAASLIHLGLSSGAAAAKPIGDGGSVLFMEAAEGGTLRSALTSAKVRMFDIDLDSYGIYLNKG